MQGAERGAITVKICRNERKSLAGVEVERRRLLA